MSDEDRKVSQTMQGYFSLAREHARCKVLVEQLDDPEAGPAAAEQLLTWLDRRTEERE